MDSLEWSKKYEVLSMSRFMLSHLGFSPERIERLTDEELLVSYLTGDDDLDLEPIVSAQFILQQTTDLFSVQDQWNKAFPITSVTRADLTSAGVSQEQAARLSDADMQAIASKMEDIDCEHGFWEDVLTAREFVEERKQSNHPLAHTDDRK